MLTQKTGLRRKHKTAIGIVGCGAIGATVARSIDRDFRKEAVLVGLSDLVKERAQRLSRRLKRNPPVLGLKALIDRSDLIIESAHASFVPEVLKKVIQKRKDLLVMSTGGVLGKERLLEKARRRGCHITLPSGALLGIDGVKAASLLPIKKVILTTRKPPQSFGGAPFILKHRINLKSIRKERLLFKGSVQEAVKAFPQNINVAATLRLAGVDPRRLEVRIIADPKAKRNRHEVTLEGELGKLATCSESVPSEENPKTSRLAVLSAIATLKALFDPVRVGT